MNLYIGSSSIGVFKLLKPINNKVLKITGGTAKGLFTNENGKFIINNIKKILKKQKINCVILHFGEVDINFSYYYKLCVDNKLINYKTFCNNVYTEYIKFIDVIVKISKCKNLIIKGLYPNPVEDIYKISQLLKYDIINDTKCIVDYKTQLNFNFQEKLRHNYNNLLKTFCNTKNKQTQNKLNVNYFYYDLDKYILNNNVMVPKYIDISHLSIHLRWEPMIQLHIKILHKFTNISTNNLININKLEQIYLKYKVNKLKKKGIYIKPKTPKPTTHKTKLHKTHKTKLHKTKIHKTHKPKNHKTKTIKTHKT